MSTSHHDHEGAPPPYVQEVSEGIFAYIQPDGSWFLNNTGFLVGKDGVVSVDTTSTEKRTRDYLDAIANVTKAPVRTLVNTHNHGDHTHGNHLLPLSTIVGHPLAREAILATDGSHPNPDIFGGGTVDWGDIRPAPPFLTFTDQITVWVDNLRVELQYIGGPAHTTNDVIAWVPERSVLFTGDLVFAGGTPFVPMGSVTGSLAALEKLKALGAKTLVPGHGPVSGPEVFDDVAAYLRFVQETAKKGKEAGLSPLDLARQTDLGRFGEWTDTERIVGNLYRAYAELDGAEPGAPINTMQALRDMITYNGGRPLHCMA